MNLIDSDIDKIYLAGPMRGIPLYNFPAFDDAAEELRFHEFDVFSPAERDRADGIDPTLPIAHDLAHFMAIDLPEVCKADALVLLPGWETSEGVSIELMVARRLGKPVFLYPCLNPLTPDEQWLKYYHARGGSVKFAQAIDEEAIADHTLARQYGATDTVGTGTNDSIVPLPEQERQAGLNNSYKETRVTDAATGGQKCAKLAKFSAIPPKALQAIQDAFDAEDGIYSPEAATVNFEEAWAGWLRREESPTEAHDLIECAIALFALAHFHLMAEHDSHPETELSPEVLLALAEHYGKGQAKYPDTQPGVANWERGYAWSLSIDAASRHWNAYRRHEMIDKETGSHHLIAVLWHCIALYEFERRKIGTDDRSEPPCHTSRNSKETCSPQASSPTRQASSTTPSPCSA